LEAAFRDWLTRDSEHAEVFDATTQIWELLGAAGKAFRAEHRRKVFRRAAITASAACFVVLVGAGMGAANHAFRRRKLSPA
jgi:ferric-dicitrate binding protein FerR (iron transport regulator)